MKTIPLTQGKVALVDDEDFERLNQFKWCATKGGNTFYAVRSQKRKTILMHREIMCASPESEVDHKNRNGLDNQKENLRFASVNQNQMNTRKTDNCSSSFRGVSWEVKRKKWRASIWLNRKGINLGRFESEVDAARAYDAAARNLFGEFASLNLESL